MNATPPPRARRTIGALAWTALVLSVPVWCVALLTPWLPIDPAQKALVATASIVIGEALFWAAGLVLGADAVAKWRRPRVTTGKSFVGKRVVVIGATGGLGGAVARAVAREGGSLVVIARNAAKLTPFAHALGAHAIVADLTPAALRAAAADAGDVDHVVVATGIDVRRSLAAHDDQDVETQLAVALAGPIHVARAFLPRLRAGGSIALFGGFGDGTLALPFHSVNVAARAGLASFCAAVNQELAIAGRTERLRYVSPAPARTDAERPFEALWHAMGTPMITPERVADFVLATLLSRNTVAIMGASTRTLTRMRAIAPALVDAIVRRRAGALLARAFGDHA